MPYNPQAVQHFWTRHVVEESRCTVCQQDIPTLHKGQIWVRPSGMRSTVEPMGQWKECTD